MRPASRSIVSIVSAMVTVSAAALAGCSGAGSGLSGSEHVMAERAAHQTSQAIISGTPATDYPEAALIDMYQNGQLFAFCSGSVIAPQVVLTAGHCVESISEWHITVPFGNNQTATATSSARYDWSNAGQETVNPNQHDVGLIFLSTPINLSSYPRIATAPLRVGATAVNVGRIQDGSLSQSELFVGDPIALDDGAQSGFPFDYQSNDVIESGDSGGPVFATRSSVHTIVAVNSGAGTGSQVLARTDLLADWIAQQIASNGDTGVTTGGGDQGSQGDPSDPSDPFSGQSLRLAKASAK